MAIRYRRRWRYRFPHMGRMLLLGLALTACSVQPVMEPELARRVWQQHQEALAVLRQWALTGRVAIAAGDEAWNATLRWRQRADQFAVQLIAPFGRGTVQLEGDPGGVALQSPDHPQALHGATAESLLRTEFGWHVPVESLRYWVLGLPDPEIPKSQSQLKFNRDGRLSQLQQRGWDVRFLRYRTVEQFELPDKIFIENHEVSVRVVIQRWRLEG